MKEHKKLETRDTKKKSPYSLGGTWNPTTNYQKAIKKQQYEN